MQERYKRFLIETFDKLSETYTNEFTVDPIEKEKIQSLVDFWDIKRGSRVLEVGGGTGDLSPFLLEKIGKEGELVFLDISPKMVEKAREKLRRYENVTFVIGDIHDINFSSQFHNIIVFNTFPHFSNKKAAFTNCYELLSNGGSLVISHNNSRWSIVGHHKRKEVEHIISEFPEDRKVFNILTDIGYSVETFENNEGHDYYLVLARKN